jgi:hypothetical protein
MANVPNARHYRTTGTSSARAGAASSGCHDDGGFRDAGPQSAQLDLPKWAPLGTLIVVLGFVVLAVKFPVATLTVCGIAFAVKLLFGKK